MKIISQTIVLLFVASIAGFAQGNSWIQKASFPAVRAYGIAFSIGNKGFVGLGTNGISSKSDFWEYDPATNAWAQKADFGGGARQGAVGFSIGAKGYAGTGHNTNTSSYYNDFWEYNPATNQWSRKADFPGGMRAYAAAFTGNSLGYVVTGWNGSAHHQLDLWAYNPASDTWLQRANYPGAGRRHAAAFSIGNKGYVGSGWDGSDGWNGRGFTDLWCYNADDNSWTEKASSASLFRHGVTAFSIAGKGYMALGYDLNTRTNTNTVWEYSPVEDRWQFRTQYPGAGMYAAASFSIGEKAFIGIGNAGVYHNDFWEYTPFCTLGNNALTAPLTTNFCSNGDPETITGTVPTGGNGTVTYQWQQSTNGSTYSDISGATNKDYNPGLLATTTYFRRTVQSGVCSNTSTAVQITVHPSAGAVITPAGPLNVCAGNGVHLSASTGASSYQWFKDNVAINGAVAQTLSVTTGGVFTVVATNPFGCNATSNPVTVTVHANPATPTITANGPISFCQGDSVTLTSSSANGNQWLKNGAPIAGALGQQFFATNSGSYSLRVTDGNGCNATSSAMAITVNPLPPAPVVTAGSLLQFCPGDSVKLTSSATSGNQWYKNGMPISNAVGAAYTAKEGGIYTVSFNNGTCSSMLSATQSVVVLDCDFPTNPFLVSTLDTTTQSGLNFASFQTFVTIGNTTYFPARRMVNSDIGLWKTDGTPAGTALIKSFGLNNTTFNPARLTNVAGTLFFTADDGEHGNELWKSNGTDTGTVMVADITPTGHSDIRNLTPVGNLLFFTMGQNLWRSDGTQDGTIMIKAGIINNAQTETDFCFASFNNHLYFTGFDATGGDELWISNGTPTGTQRLKNIRSGAAGSSPRSLTVSNGSLFFIAFSAAQELWKSDGSEAGTVAVKAIANFMGGNNRLLCDVAGTLFFAAASSTDYELWKSDGTPAGTAMVKNIHPSGSSFPQSLTAVNDQLYFSALTPAAGRELWLSDGTADGTTMVADIFPGTTGSNPVWIAAANGLVYFNANGSGSQGNELWKTDGTTTGTALILDINPGNAAATPAHLTVNEARIVFMADNGVAGPEPWATDGTAQNTRMLKDINNFRPVAAPLTQLTGHNGNVYFVGQSKVSASVERHLWRSNGTTGGTVNVTVANDNPPLANAPFGNLTSVGSHLYFTANGAFATDGNSTTFLNLPAQHFLKAGRKLYFVSGGLYITNGTPGNATLLCNQVLAAPAADVNGILYFVGHTAATGYELWKTDGTAAGTMLVKDVVAGSAPSNITEMVAVDGKLFFTTPTQIWTSDGTNTGTTMVKSFTASPGFLKAFNGRLYFVGHSGANGQELWSSDGTPSGTAMVKDIFPGAGNGLNTNNIQFNPWFTVVGSDMFFAATDSLNGVELWKTDGTENGTLLVKDINPGSGHSYLASLTEAAGYLFFIANDGINGTEIWQSGGSAECTYMVNDLYPGTQNGQPNSGNPQQLISVNDVLYFSAYMPHTGWALFKFNPLLSITTNTVYTFTGSGNWTDRGNWCNNNRPPSILPAGSEIVIKPSGDGTCILNTPQVITPGSKLTVAEGVNFVVQGNISDR